MRQVDTRESNWAGIVEPLLLTGWERATLLHGDFRWEAFDGTRVGATRKAMPDLLNSVGETFAGQLEQMLAEYDVCILLLEDSPDVAYDSANDDLVVVLHDRTIRRSRLAIVNFVHRFQAKGFVLERTRGPEHTVRRLNELYTMYQKPYSRSSYSRRFGDDRILALCSGLRGSKGERLLSGRSLREVCNMTVPELQSFDGIGPTLAERQWQHANRKVH